MEDVCIVCAEPLEWVAFGPCGHKDACDRCVCRLRSVMKDYRCVLCQVPSKAVFVTRWLGGYTAGGPAGESEWRALDDWQEAEDAKAKAAEDAAAEDADKDGDDEPGAGARGDRGAEGARSDRAGGGARRDGGAADRDGGGRGGSGRRGAASSSSSSSSSSSPRGPLERTLSGKTVWHVPAASSFFDDRSEAQATFVRCSFTHPALAGRPPPRRVDVASPSASGDGSAAEQEAGDAGGGEGEGVGAGARSSVPSSSLPLPSAPGSAAAAARAPPTFPTLRALRAALAKRRGLHLCPICLEGRKVFVSEQEAYSKRDLDRHVRTGDAPGALRESGFSGHPECRFCRRRFYGEQELFAHMTSTHEQCFLCRRADPHTHEYFENYRALERHFSERHYACTHPECLERKFVVFATQAELRHHILREHADSLSKAERRQPVAVELEYSFGGGDRGADARAGRRGRDPRAAHALPMRSGVTMGGGAGASAQRGPAAEAAARAAALATARLAAARAAEAETGPGLSQALVRRTGELALHEPSLFPGMSDGAPGAAASSSSAAAASSSSAAAASSSAAAAAPQRGSLLRPMVGAWSGSSGRAGGLSLGSFPSLPRVTRAATRKNKVSEREMAELFKTGAGTGAGPSARPGAQGRVPGMGAGAAAQGRVPGMPGASAGFLSLGSVPQRGSSRAGNRILNVGAKERARNAGGEAEPPSAASAAAPPSASSSLGEGLARLDRRTEEDDRIVVSSRGGKGGRKEKAGAEEGAGAGAGAGAEEGAGAAAGAGAEEGAGAGAGAGAEEGAGGGAERGAEEGAGAPRPDPSSSSSAAAPPSAASSEAAKAAARALAARLRSRLSPEAFASFRSSCARWAAGELPDAELVSIAEDADVADALPDVAATCPIPGRRDGLLDALAQRARDAARAARDAARAREELAAREAQAQGRGAKKGGKGGRRGTGVHDDDDEEEEEGEDGCQTAGDRLAPGPSAAPPSPSPSSDPSRPTIDAAYAAQAAARSEHVARPASRRSAAVPLSALVSQRVAAPAGWGARGGAGPSAAAASLSSSAFPSLLDGGVSRSARDAVTATADGYVPPEVLAALGPAGAKAGARAGAGAKAKQGASGGSWAAVGKAGAPARASPAPRRSASGSSAAPSASFPSLADAFPDLPAPRPASGPRRPAAGRAAPPREAEPLPAGLVPLARDEAPIKVGGAKAAGKGGAGEAGGAKAAGKGAAGEAGGAKAAGKGGAGVAASKAASAAAASLAPSPSLDDADPFALGSASSKRGKSKSSASLSSAGGSKVSLRDFVTGQDSSKRGAAGGAGGGRPRGAWSAVGSLAKEQGAYNDARKR